jgi:tetratricopeptide (TPR) repeat protein
MKKTFRMLLTVSVACMLFAAACEKSQKEKASAAMEQGDYWTAISLYEQIAAKDPGDKAVKERLTEARLKLAKKFAIEAIQGSHPDAADWERLIAQLELCPEACKIELLDSLHVLAGIYEKSGKRDQALAILVKALARDPSRRIAVGKINDLVLATKDPVWGRQTFEKIWKMHGKDPVICIKYGRFLAANEFLGEAIVMYDKCLELGTGDFTYTNDIKLEISTLERRKKAADEKKSSPQPGAPEQGESPER